MLEKIVVALDGSPLAELALPHAQSIASRAGSTLVLVRAARYTGLSSDVAINQVRVIAEAEEYLNRLAGELKNQGFSVETAVPFGGSSAEWIVEEAEVRHADLIIMATHDRIGPDRWRHGSVAEGVVHRSSTPVMLVRASSPQPSPSKRTNVLMVPLDGSILAEAALPVGVELAHAMAARMVLLAVVPKSGQLVAGQGGTIVTYVGAEHARLEAEARAYLESVVGRAALEDAGVETVIRFGERRDAIGAASDEYGAAGIVMATHGRAGLVRSMLGSVAGGVLHRSERPVILVHPVASSQTNAYAAAAMRS